MFQMQPTKRQGIATHGKGVISISFLQFHTPLPHIKKKIGGNQILMDEIGVTSPHPQRTKNSICENLC